MNTLKTGNIISYFISNSDDRKLDVYCICKLLYLLDSRFYRLFGRTITELNYAKMPYGPAPDNYEHVLAILVNPPKYIYLSESLAYNIYKSEFQPDLNVLDEDEREMLVMIDDMYNKNKDFQHFYELTHDEKPYNLSKYKYGDIFNLEDLRDTEEDFNEALNKAISII